VKHNIYTPKTGWIVVDDSIPAENKSPYIGGVSMTENSIRDNRHVFTRQQRRVGKNKTVKDVDRALDSFQARYPHLGRPDRVRKDPFPSVKIKDERRCQSE
jgi:hypothetical protein